MSEPDPLTDLGREIGEMIVAAGFAKFAFVITVSIDGTILRSTCGIEGPPILKTLTALSADRFQKEPT